MWRLETTDLTELDVAKVRVGAPTTLTFDALPGLELATKVTQIKAFGESHQGDIVYAVEIVPERYEPRLRWNMTASAAITP